MEWSDYGTVLGAQPFGETGARVEVFTQNHGRHAGLVRGGAGRKRAPDLQPGTYVSVTWRARLGEHLGVFSLEAERARAAALLADRLALSGLNAVCGLSLVGLPERQTLPDFHKATETLFDLMTLTPAWTLAYLRWEVDLLEVLGAGLDLTRCAVSGDQSDLQFISPKTGRAVSADAAGEWADRLLPFPAVLKGEGTAPDREILDGLDVTGHFLTRAFRLQGIELPPARARLLDAIARHSAGTKTS
ncbi:MAG: DNA repair protein RecO [Pseudomonadota bacterium]